MTSVGFTVATLPVAGTFSLQVYTGAGTAGGLLLTQTISVVTAGPKTYTLTTPLPINFGAAHTFNLRDIGTANMTLAASNLNPYAGGAMYYNGGIVGTYDLGFQIGVLAYLGAALNFDGVDDYVNLGTSAAIRPTTALSVETWAYMAGLDCDK